MKWKRKHCRALRSHVADLAAAVCHTRPTWAKALGTTRSWAAAWAGGRVWRCKAGGQSHPCSFPAMACACLVPQADFYILPHTHTHTHTPAAHTPTHLQLVQLLLQSGYGALPLTALGVPEFIERWTHGRDIVLAWGACIGTDMRRAAKPWLCMACTASPAPCRPLTNLRPLHAANCFLRASCAILCAACL